MTGKRILFTDTTRCIADPPIAALNRLRFPIAASRAMCRSRWQALVIEMTTAPEK